MTVPPRLLNCVRVDCKQMAISDAKDTYSETVIVVSYRIRAQPVGNHNQAKWVTHTSPHKRNVAHVDEIVKHILESPCRVSPRVEKGSSRNPCLSVIDIVKVMHHLLLALG